MEKEKPVRLRFNSQPTIHWTPAPLSFFGTNSKNLPRGGLIRSVSVTYPGGRPNVVTQRPRSHHLPSLHAKPRSALSSGCSIEKPTRKSGTAARDRMFLTRSLYEIQNSALANCLASSHPDRLETSFSTDGGSL
ncbi:unnamed protein product [Gongylonema pulchrum]|uniref:Uncharacterized protein n=1 Tax=Gongylonema pulchrum TaxID=637853 RepID=A0A183CUW7_9BILA|nr:unnamed protein product [Gongylonema pulchrum]VDN26481.1 unnamed protein product [Gongylonema pulchrum]